MAQQRRVAVTIDLSVGLRHHHDVFAGIGRYAQEHPNWDCFVQPFFRTLQKARGETGYHGIVGRATADLAQQALQSGVPMVNVWSGSPAKTLPCVLPDFEASGRIAAGHLLQRGFRQFAFLGFAEHGGTPLALAGYKAVLRAAEHRVTTQIVSPRCDEDARNWDRFSTRLERWVGGWKLPIGVFAINDIICRYLANTCRHIGLQIPLDVSLIGFTNEVFVCTHPEPSLSSVDAGFERVGYEAAALLDRLMDGAPAPASPIFVAPTELVVRRSTDAYVVDDPLVAAALRFITGHSHAGIRVEDVAKEVHATLRTLERHFRASLGRTMGDEINRLRLEFAKRLLVESKDPVKEVARNCGFSDAKYFHEAFFKAEGTSPTAYRRLRIKR